MSSRKSKPAKVKKPLTSEFNLPKGWGRKKKSDCTPEEWDEICAYKRVQRSGSREKPDPLTKQFNLPKGWKKMRKADCTPEEWDEICAYERVLKGGSREKPNPLAKQFNLPKRWYAMKKSDCTPEEWDEIQAYSRTLVDGDPRLLTSTERSDLIRAIMNHPDTLEKLREANAERGKDLHRKNSGNYHVKGKLRGILWDKYGIADDPDTRIPQLKDQCGGIPFKPHEQAFTKHTGMVEAAHHLWAGLLCVWDYEGDQYAMTNEQILEAIKRFDARDGQVSYLMHGIGVRERTDKLTPAQADEIWKRGLEFDRWLGDTCPLTGERV